MTLQPPQSYTPRVLGFRGLEEQAEPREPQNPRATGRGQGDVDSWIDEEADDGDDDSEILLALLISIIIIIIPIPILIIAR